MNGKKLGKELLNMGYVFTDKKVYEKTFVDMQIEVNIYEGIFGKISMIGIIYKFKQPLAEELHDEVWNDCEVLLKAENSAMQMGALGCEFIEASILNKEVLNNITAEIVEENCLIFAEEIRPVIKHLGL